MDGIKSLDDLVALCLALGAASTGDLTAVETAVADKAGDVSSALVDQTRRAILSASDPLGDAFSRVVSAADRRANGQTYTPEEVVASMVSWASERRVARIIDPGAGSGRFIIAALARFPGAHGIAAEIDPVAALMLRANAAVLGLGDRLTITLGDYRSLQLEDISGPSLFLGNPPYVRHHDIAPEWKTWLVTTAERHGIAASRLAGLHAHFFLATAEHGRPGDLGVFVTSAEWLDVKYGRLVRELLLGCLGGTGVHVLDPKVEAFPGTATTAAITTFEVGAKPDSVRLRQVSAIDQLGDLSEGKVVSTTRLAETDRWSVLTRTMRAMPADYVELGELCRVHRGAVTGANDAWVASPLARHRLPEHVLFPSITRARELFNAGERLNSTEPLKRVIDLPADLDALAPDEREVVDRFLRSLRRKGVHKGYIAKNRHRWWRVGLREPAPVLATYMARRPPAFVVNDVDACHLNIAHGLYPREPMHDSALRALVEYLRTSVSTDQGRTYSGGLTKFEPREMERIPVPSLQLLSA